MPQAIHESLAFYSCNNVAIHCVFSVEENTLNFSAWEGACLAGVEIGLLEVLQRLVVLLQGFVAS